MGSGIATTSILAGNGVLLKEINAKFLEVRFAFDWHVTRQSQLQLVLDGN